MRTHLYLNLIPESLVASALAPAAYGNYMAVGLHAKTRGQAIFFEVDHAAMGAEFDVASALARCERESESHPKHSVYVAIYRVLERVPDSALGRLYLATDDGRVLALNRSEFEPEPDRAAHLYQELVPVKPLVVSRLAPPEFAAYITAAGQPVSVPRIAFAELALEGLHADPFGASPENLPYPHLEHLRDCIVTLLDDPQKQTKLVLRHFHHELLFRTVRNGFFVGGKGGFAYYPLPPREKLESEHREWLRSAETVHIE